MTCLIPTLRYYGHFLCPPHLPPPPPLAPGVRINGFVYNNKVEGRLLCWIFASIRV